MPQTPNTWPGVQDPASALAAIKALFPFFIEVDHQGCVLDVGAALRKGMKPLVQGAPFGSLFEASADARFRRTDARFFGAQSGRFIRMALCEDPSRELHGGWYLLGLVEIFLGWPLINREEDLAQWGIDRVDIPAHFPIADFMMLLHIGQNNLTDAQQLNELLMARSADLERKNLELSHFARHDGLTGLPNHLEVTERLEQSLAQAKARGTRLAVLLVDIVKMKSINDLWGFDVGDQVVCQISTRIQSSLASPDFVGREHGDEFVVVLHNIASRDEVESLAQNWLANLGRSLRVGEIDIGVSVSLGVAIFPDDGTRADHLIRGADAALHDVKRRGGKALNFRSADAHARLVERLALMDGLRNAAARGEFSLEYQPVVDIPTRRIVGAEALLRWQHPDRGRIAPDRFIPLAEECGLMPEIGDWVLNTACREAQQWAAPHGEPLRVAVNLSAFELRRVDVAQRVAQVLDSSGLLPSRLTLELTESGLLEDEAATIAQFGALRDLGVRIAMDDFGTGYSGLQAASRLPFDVIKLDRSFLSIVRPSERALIRTAIDLARHLGMDLVAEGVETIEQHQFLLESSCSRGQGYLYARPLKAEALRALISVGFVLGSEEPVSTMD